MRVPCPTYTTLFVVPDTPCISPATGTNYTPVAGAPSLGDGTQSFGDDELKALGFERGFGRKNAPAMERLRAVAVAAAGSVGRYDGVADQTPDEDGDFEVRVSQKLIHQGNDGGGREVELGVQQRRVGQDVAMTYIDVTEMSTTKVEHIIPYLELIKLRSHVNEDGGRKMVMVVGDQQIFAHLYKAKEADPLRFRWILPCPGDWHLMDHALDVIFRKFGGFAIMPLAKAAGCFDKKLESGDFHKRHFVLMAVMEALMVFTVEEVEQRKAHHAGGQARAAGQAGGGDVAGGGANVDGGGRGEGADGQAGRSPVNAASPADRIHLLRTYDAPGEHKSFGVFTRFLLDDGMAYLSLYVSIRIGDFDLREAALRQIAPLFLVNGKDKYHELAMQHLRELAGMTPSQRTFASQIFSLSLAGNAAKNQGLDEIQETMMNREIKTSANRGDVRYLQTLAWTLQAKHACRKDVLAKFGADQIRGRAPADGANPPRFIMPGEIGQRHRSKARGGTRRPYSQPRPGEVYARGRGDRGSLLEGRC